MDSSVFQDVWCELNHPAKYMNRYSTNTGNFFFELLKFIVAPDTENNK